MKYNKVSLLVCGLAILLMVPGAYAGQNANAKYNVDFDIVTAGNDQDIINNDLGEGDSAIGPDTEIAFAVYGTGFQNLKSFDLRVSYDNTLVSLVSASSSNGIPAILLLNGAVVQPVAELNILDTDLEIVTSVSETEISVSRTLSGTINEDTCPDGEGLLYFFVFKTNSDFVSGSAFRITLKALECVDVAGNTDPLRHNFYGYVNKGGTGTTGVKTSTWGAVKTLFK